MFNNPNITVHFNTETVDVVSNTKGQMSGILLRKVDTGEESVLEAKGLFYGIGHSPNSQLLQGQVELDSSGYVIVEEGTAKTSVEGVFAAGDVQVLRSKPLNLKSHSVFIKGLSRLIICPNYPSQDCSHVIDMIVVVVIIDKVVVRIIGC